HTYVTHTTVLTRTSLLTSSPFFFYGYGDPRDLHSFPTRRSSDLPVEHGLIVRVNAVAPGPILTRARDHASAEEVERVAAQTPARSEEHTSELQSPYDLVCRLLLEKKKKKKLKNTRRHICKSPT